MATTNVTVPSTFSGHEWQDLTRLVTACRMKFIQTAAQETDDFDEDPSKCAYLVGHFRGPALDWVGTTYDANPAIFNDYNGFILAVRNAFGISDDGLRAQHRGALESLSWQHDLAVFFAEFDRLTTTLQLTGDEPRIAILRSKLPLHVRKLLSEQALDFRNYDTMRERLLTMWNLDPSRSITHAGGSSSTAKRPRCGKCKKTGHTAPDCRSKN